MAGNRAKKCRCKNSRLVSNGALNSVECMDVCTTPLCGNPSMLSVLAPVIYDEIGINLCATFDLGVDVLATYPTADRVALTVRNIGMTFGEPGAVTIESIAGRPNCYLVTLGDLAVDFIARIYDSANRLLGTIPVTAVYLPPDITAPTYNEDTNPTAVELEIYAPYGLAYETDTVQPIISFTGFGVLNNFITQGLNLTAIPKVLDFDLEASTITVGLSLFLRSLYFAAYKIPTEGRSVAPKGSIIPEEQSVCMNFVEGSLLDLNIRPLELGKPNYEENLKNDMLFATGGCGCSQLTSATDREEVITVPEEPVE